MTFHYTNHQEKFGRLAVQHLGLEKLGWFPPFAEVAEKFAPLIKGLTQRFKETAQELNVWDEAAMAQLLYLCLAVHNAGAPVFRLQPDLVQMLKETDLPKDMSLDFLRLPFEGICLDFPAGTLGGTMQTATRLLLSAVQKDRFRLVCFPDSFNTHYMSIRMPGAAASPTGLAADARTIADAVEETRARMFEGMSEDAARELKRTWVYQDYYESDAFSFAVNAALYLTSEGADIEQDRSVEHELHTKLQGLKKKTKRERLEQQLKQEKEHKIYICGGHTKLAREMTTTLTEEGRQLTKRFRVRGHWKNQACGTAWQDHKHIFVQPFWKGPTYAELLERNYVVERRENA